MMMENGTCRMFAFDDSTSMSNLKDKLDDSTQYSTEVLDDSSDQASTTTPCSVTSSCPCECRSCEIQRELYLLRENSDQLLNEEYNELNSSEIELSRYLKEINDLEEDLKMSQMEENELYLELEKLERQMSDGEQYYEDYRSHKASDPALELELKRRDDKIKEMEEDLIENMKLIQHLRLSAELRNN